jgi:uncharacterized protein YhjY with autotransporter beta-barrel domain
MVRGISMECTRSTAPVMLIAEAAHVAGGSTNAIEVTAGLTGSWQQDIEQSIMPPILWSQSSLAVEFAGAFL